MVLRFIGVSLEKLSTGVGVDMICFISIFMKNDIQSTSFIDQNSLDVEIPDSQCNDQGVVVRATQPVSLTLVKGNFIILTKCQASRIRTSGTAKGQMRKFCPIAKPIDRMCPNGAKTSKGKNGQEWAKMGKNGHKWAKMGVPR